MPRSADDAIAQGCRSLHGDTKDQFTSKLGRYRVYEGPEARVESQLGCCAVL